MKTPNLTESGGHRDPFVVDDAYFETLADRIMQRIEEQAARDSVLQLQRTRRVSLIWRCAAAACVALVAGLGALKYAMDNSVNNAYEAEMANLYYFAETADDDEWNEALDYVAIDNQQIAYYLTDNY